jgi:hypothetical protein
MTQIARTRVILSGWEGAPGVNTFHWTGVGHTDIGDVQVDAFHDILHDAYDAITGSISGDVDWSIEPMVNIFEHSTGELVGWRTQSGAVITGGGTGTGLGISRAEQICMRWVTNDVVGNRRLQGRNFFGPISSAIVDSAGQIPDATATALEGYMSGLLDPYGPRLAVWHQPPSTDPTSGAFGDVVSAVCFKHPAVLRSRRD